MEENGLSLLLVLKGSPKAVLNANAIVFFCYCVTVSSSIQRFTKGCVEWKNVQLFFCYCVSSSIQRFTKGCVEWNNMQLFFLLLLVVVFRGSPKAVPVCVVRCRLC